MKVLTTRCGGYLRILKRRPNERVIEESSQKKTRPKTEMDPKKPTKIQKEDEEDEEGGATTTTKKRRRTGNREWE